jgi:hypothetical protein
MRRFLAILLIAFFGLGPLSAGLSADDDSGLPPCCRRHGAHHCAMAMRMAAMMAKAFSGSTPVFTAPLTCPLYPGYTAATTAPPPAIAAAGVTLPVLLAQPHSPSAGRAAARVTQLRTRANRGPPALLPS